MIFHRLRLISFSKSVLSLRGSSKKNKEVKVRTADVSKVVEVSMPKVAQKKQDLEENTKECIQNSSSSSKRLLVGPRLEFKSKSETFRIPSKKLKKRATRRTLSLSDLKRRLSLKDSLNSNRIKERIKSFKKVKASKKKKEITNKNEIKVLYVAEVKPRNRRRPKHRRKHDMSQSYCDLFGFYRNKRLMDPNTFYHRYKNDDNPFQKLRMRSARKRKKLREASIDTHQPLKVITSGKLNHSQSDKAGCSTVPLHYNLLRFPQSSKSKLCQKNSLRLYRSGALANVCRDSVACYSVIDKPYVPDKVSQGQAVSASSFKTPVAYVDMAVSTCKSLKLPSTSKMSYKVRTSSKTRSVRRKCKLSMRKFPISMIYSKYYRKFITSFTAAHSKHGTSTTTKNIVKYILISIVILAWSPCMLGLGIGWLLSYPLRPQHVISAYNRKNYKCSDKCYLSQCHIDWWSKFIGFTRRVLKASRYSLSSMLRSKKQNEPAANYNLPHCSSHPDPEKRYILYHADGRGWVIKPNRTNVPPKQNRFLQVFQNLFCDCNHPNISQHQEPPRVRRRTNSSSHATGSVSVCPENKFDSKHRDKIGLTPPKPQTAEGSFRQSAQSKDTVCECKPIQNAAGKKTVSGILVDTKHNEHTDKRSRIRMTPPTPQKPEAASKPCAQPDETFHSPKEAKSTVIKETRYSCHSRKSIIKTCQGDKVCLTPPKPQTPQGPSKPGAQSTDMVCECKPIQSAAGKKPVSGKLLDTKLGNKVGLVSSKQNPQETTKPPCTMSICSGLLKTKRSRSASSRRLSDPELVQPIPKRSRSVSKKSEVKRRGSKPDRIAITERGPITCKSGGPQKIISIKVCRTKNTQTGKRQNAPATKKTQVRKLPSLKTPPAAPRRDEQKKPSSRTKKKQFKIIKFFTKPKIKKVPLCRRFGAWLRGLGRKTAESVKSFDDELYNALWPVKVGCRDAYVYTLKARPWFWIYRCCPASYPAFLRWYYCSKSCCYHCMFSISICFWAPIACWCYICYQLCLCCCN